MRTKPKQNNRKRNPKMVIGATLATVLLGTGSAVAELHNYTVGGQPDGSVVVPTNQVLTPAGKQVQINGLRPNAIAMNPDGKTAALLTAGWNGCPLVTIVDLTTGAVKQELQTNYGGGAPTGIVYSKDGRHLYASDTRGSIMIANVNSDDTLSLDSMVSLPTSSTMWGSAYPTGLSLSDDGNTLYICLNRYNALGEFDIATRKLVNQIPVGNAPFGVVVDGNKAYVSNEGGRVAQSGDFTNQSSGTQIVADRQSGGASTGTVSVVDLTTHQVVKTITVGLHPTGMHMDGKYLFVANTNSDSVSVIDTTTDEVVKTINVHPFPNSPFGSSPTAVTTTTNGQLLVSLGANNALGVYNWQGPSNPVSFEGLIPTGWYPGDVAVNPQTQQIIVANVKGIGSLGDGNAETKQAYSQVGTVSVMSLPQPKELADDTAKVFQNNHWDHNAWNQIAKNNGNVNPVAIPSKIGNPSTIKHVFFIIKENRTYDQVLGDLTRGNGDPKLVQFGANVSPNEHALATQFPLFDNFYASGIASDEGHQWLDEAYVTSYLEKMEYGGPERAYPYNGGDSLAYSPTGFIWEDALNHGLTVRDYGEYASQYNGPQSIGWADATMWSKFYQDSQIMEGKQSGTLNFPQGTYQASSDVPSLKGILNLDYPAFTSVSIPDQYRADIFINEFNQYEKNGNLPNLTLISLPNDHTAGSTPGEPTDNAMVADNDLALGRIVDTISHSPDWKNSAIFVVEDDAQSGTDHVDGHRTTAFVISPYAKKNFVDSTFYTQIDMLRTMEQILGIPPMNQMDLAATPMFDAFTNTPNFAPYNVVPNQIPLDQLTPAPTAQTSALVKAWGAASAKALGVGSKVFQEDMHSNVLNHAIWYSTKGYNTPYPGESKVLWPSQVKDTMTNTDY